MPSRSHRPKPSDTRQTVELRVHSGLAEVPKDAWNALVPAAARPFLTWEFLELLESSGSAIEARGWRPLHLTLWQGATLVGAAPGWVKTHSIGELFYNDFRWSAVTPRFGVDYYPKYVITAPFTPIASPKLLVKDGEDAPALRRALARGALAVAAESGFSSAAVLFASPEDLEALEAEGFAGGAGMQFHWENKGFRTFDDFLARFNSKRRHMVRSERAQPPKDGTTIRTVTGDALTPDLLAFASRCYTDTVDRHAWHDPHLTPAFFARIAERLPGAVEIVLAEEAGKPLAMAFNLRGEKRLYGRHWGTLADRRYLHFNVCYYHSVERCIALGLDAFEPGAGGEHKLARGFEPALVRSAHAFVDPALHAAMAAYLRREVASYEAEVARAREEGLAFRSGGKGQEER